MRKELGLMDVVGGWRLMRKRRGRARVERVVLMEMGELGVGRRGLVLKVLLTLGKV